MGLNNINSKSTWGQAASDINTNFTTIDSDLKKVKNATTRNKGYFSSIDELKAAFSTANVGDIAYVGSAYPYAIWKWNGSAWANSGSTGGEESVNLGNYYTKSETDGKFTETDAKLSELGQKVDELDAEVTNTVIEEKTTEFSITDDEEKEEYVKVTEDGLFAKSLNYKNGENFVNVQDVLPNNETISDAESEFVVEDDNGEILFKVDKNGIHGAFSNSYNDVTRNKNIFSSPIYFVKNKIVDKQNRCVISFNGDSIIGSQLDDITESPEFTTGNFPPNMSKMIMARKFYDKYKFSGEDTQFRNLKHSDWVKYGFDKSWKYKPNGTELLTFNEIETYGCNSENDYAEITVSGYKFFKLIWSECRYSGWGVNVKISVDGGDYSNPSDLGVDLPDAITTKNAWEAPQNMVRYEVCELDKSKTYKIRISPQGTGSGVTFWGCEYWNNPRLDVVVEAYSGCTAINTVESRLDSFCSDWHKPFGVVMDLLTTNDNSYIFNSNDTINGWMEANATIYDLLKRKGIPVLAFRVHSDNNITKAARCIAEMNNLAYIDIPNKLTELNVSKSSIVNTTDAIHLSNYGQDFYFEELDKLFK